MPRFLLHNATSRSLEDYEDWKNPSRPKDSEGVEEPKRPTKPVLTGSVLKQLPQNGLFEGKNSDRVFWSHGWVDECSSVSQNKIASECCLLRRGYTPKVLLLGTSPSIWLAWLQLLVSWSHSTCSEISQLSKAHSTTSSS